MTEDAFRRLRDALGVGLPVGDAPAEGVGPAEAVGMAEGTGSGLLAEGVGVGLGDGHRMGTGMTQPGWVAAAGRAARAACPGSQGGGLDGRNGYGMLNSLAIHNRAAELLETCPFSWLEATSKALPDTEMDAASTPSVVNATRTAAAAMAGTNKTANRRQHTRPCGAGSAGLARRGPQTCWWRRA